MTNHVEYRIERDESAGGHRTAVQSNNMTTEPDVLYVDEKRDRAETVSTFLSHRKPPLLVETVHSVEEAFRLLERREFDCIVSCAQLSERSGIDLLEVLEELLAHISDTVYIRDHFDQGIAEEMINQIFERGVTTQDSGTGYGLAIVDDIVSAHGWDISVATDANGARFEITGVDVVDPTEVADG